MIISRLNFVLAGAITILMADRYRLQLSLGRCESSYASWRANIEGAADFHNRQLTEVESQLSALSAVFSAENTRAPKLKHGDNSLEDVQPKSSTQKIQNKKSGRTSKIEEFSSAFSAETYDLPLLKGRPSPNSAMKSDLMTSKYHLSTQSKQGTPSRAKSNNPPSFIVGSPRQQRTATSIFTSLKNRSVTSLRPTTILRNSDGSRDDHQIETLYAHMFWGTV